MEVQIPQKILSNFQKPAFNRVFYGGRGSGKTVSLAKLNLVRHYSLAARGISGLSLCTREIQDSLKDSTLSELKSALDGEDMAPIRPYFRATEQTLRTINLKGRVDWAFQGLDRNIASVKSKAPILTNWTDEAEGVNEYAWQTLLPSIRGFDGVENWASFNPLSPDSATYSRFVANADKRTIATEINYYDNPWFPDHLDELRKSDLERDPEAYAHIWEGQFLVYTDAQIFHGKWEVREFDEEGLGDPLHGMDFGLTVDPLAAVRCYLHDGVLYVSHEAYSKGIDSDMAGDFINPKIPGIQNYVIRADSAEPRTINDFKKRFFPKITGVKKWPNSVIEGVRWMRGLKRIVIHPRCPNTAREFRLYSFKTDRRTKDVLPDILNQNDHAIDAIRYALQPMISSYSTSVTKQYEVGF